MAKNPNIKKEAAKEKEPIIINEIIVRSADRSPKDISDWKNAHEYATSIYNPNRTNLYDLYENIELDGHLTGITGKRVDAVLNKTLRFVINGKKVDGMDDVIESDVFRRIVKQIMKRQLWGLSGMEFIPGPELAFEEIPPKHIKPELKIIAKEQFGQDGFNYDGVWNLWVLGNKKDLGLLLKCVPYALMKRGNMADWAQYIELFGQPVRVVKYDAYDTKTKMELKKVLDTSGSSLAIMIPKQADFEMKDGKQSNGDGKLQESFKKACDDEMSVIVLGNTETTTSSKSSGYAQSKEHGKQQIQVTKSDLKDVVNQLNSKQFLNILQSYGLPVQGGKFEYEKEIDLEELKQKLDIDITVSEKVPVGDNYWYETFGIPKPDDYDKLKAEMEAKKQISVPAFPPDRPVKKPKKDKKPDQDKLSFIDKLKITLSDFFGQAPQ